jgi:hypothetical protein
MQPKCIYLHQFYPFALCSGLTKFNIWATHLSLNSLKRRTDFNPENFSSLFWQLQYPCIIDWIKKLTYIFLQEKRIGKEYLHHRPQVLDKTHKVNI